MWREALAANSSEEIISIFAHSLRHRKRTATLSSARSARRKVAAIEGDDWRGQTYRSRRNPGPKALKIFRSISERTIVHNAVPCAKWRLSSQYRASFCRGELPYFAYSEALTLPSQPQPSSAMPRLRAPRLSRNSSKEDSNSRKRHRSYRSPTNTDHLRTARGRQGVRPSIAAMARR